MRREPGPQPSAVVAPLIPATVQQRWGVPHATWFTLMGVGGGVFLLARLYRPVSRLGLLVGLPVVDLVSFVAIAAGGLILVADLGRPFRLVRAVCRPGTSWISRGAIADFVFLLAGGVLVLPGLRLGAATPLRWLPWDAEGAGAIGRAVEAAALVSAAVVVYYAGQVLADQTAIPYWRSPAIPVQFGLSSFAISLTVLMGLESWHRQPIGPGQCGLLLGLLAALLATVAWHVRTGVARPGKAESLDWLLRGRYRRAFLGGVVGAGTVLPMALAAVGLVAPAVRDAMGVLALAATLGGGFGLRLLTLRVGIFPPVRARLTLGRR